MIQFVPSGTVKVKTVGLVYIVTMDFNPQLTHKKSYAYFMITVDEVIELPTVTVTIYDPADNF